MLGRRNVFVTKALVLSRTRGSQEYRRVPRLKARTQHANHGHNVLGGRVPRVKPLPRFVVLHLEFAKGVLPRSSNFVLFSWCMLNHKNCSGNSSRDTWSGGRVASGEDPSRTCPVERDIASAWLVRGGNAASRTIAWLSNVLLVPHLIRDARASEFCGRFDFRATETNIPRDKSSELRGRGCYLLFMCLVWSKRIATTSYVSPLPRHVCRRVDVDYRCTLFMPDIHV